MKIIIDLDQVIMEMAYIVSEYRPIVDLKNSKGNVVIDANSYADFLHDMDIILNRAISTCARLEEDGGG